MAKSSIFIADKIVVRNIDECKPYEDNPRINSKAIDKVAKSIEDFGFTVPMVIDKDGFIVTGHTRRKAAKKLGMTKVPTIDAKHLTEEQIRAFRIADNKLSELADWDYDLLGQELGLLAEAGIDLSRTGFEIEEAVALIPDIDLDLDNAGVNELESHVTQSKRVGIHLGKYKFYVTREEFTRWEDEALSAHKSRTGILQHYAGLLGFKEVEIDDKA